MVDGEPVSVTASVEFADPRIDVNSAFTLEFEGSDTPVTASVGISGDGVEVTPEEGYIFFGTEGRLQYADGTIDVKRRDGTRYRTEIEGGSGFKRLNHQKLRNFVASIEREVDPAVPGSDALRVIAVTEAVYHADELGEKVSVQSLIEQTEPS
jgi:predicted dehydrogenase